MSRMGISVRMCWKLVGEVGNLDLKYHPSSTLPQDVQSLLQAQSGALAPRGDIEPMTRGLGGMVSAALPALPSAGSSQGRSA